MTTSWNDWEAPAPAGLDAAPWDDWEAPSPLGLDAASWDDWEAPTVLQHERYCDGRTEDGPCCSPVPADGTGHLVGCDAFAAGMGSIDFSCCSPDWT